MKKTEEAILKIREELDNITIPDIDILQKSYEYEYKQSLNMHLVI